ncbi:MarC family protein [Xanthobacteraceae bacterium A53D]
MLEDFNLFITQFVTLYALLEPISHLSMFLALTGDHTPAERRKLAVLSVLFSMLILTFFALVGQALLHAMDISVLSFQIAGGIILFLFSLQMIFSGPHQATGPKDEKSLASFAIYPLATPTIAGPGAMLSVVLLADNNRASFVAQGITVAAVGSVMLILLVTFLAGDLVNRLIGSSGTNLVRRIMGMIIAALSVNLILTALAKWLSLPPI